MYTLCFSVCVYMFLSSCPPEYTKKSLVTFFFKISLQVYIIVVRNKKNLHIFTFLLWKQTICFPAIGIFLLNITATALVTQNIMQRKTMFYQRFVNWIKGSVIIDFSTEHNWTSITVNFYKKNHVFFYQLKDSCFNIVPINKKLVKHLTNQNTEYDRQRFFFICG